MGDAGRPLADELTEEGSVARPMQPFCHVGIQLAEAFAGAAAVGLQDQQDDRQFLQIDFLYKAVNLFRIGGRTRGQKEQAVGIRGRVLADSLEGALPED